MKQENFLFENPRLAHFTVERALASILWLDEKGDIHFANEKAQDQYGYSKTEFSQLSIFDLDPVAEQREYKVIWQKSKAVTYFQFESAHLKKNGSEFPIEAFINRVDFEGSSYVVAFILDITERKRKEKLLKSVIEATTGTLGKDFFQSLVEKVAQALAVDVVMATECTDTSKRRLRTLAFYKDGSLQANTEYDTQGTPCAMIMEHAEPLHIEEGVDRVYAKGVGTNGYFGIPIIDRENATIGHIAIFKDKPLSLSNDEKEILKIFSDRAATEIERVVANEKLVKALDEIKDLKDKLEAENTYLQQEIQLEHNFDEIITQSVKYKSILLSLEQAAVTNASVLILGESGTGKELLARAIHNISKRSDRPLVKVNCATLPANLIESELFGHEKGAFTGAIATKIGRFELADSGTLFLDEIGELPLELQSKLLRALQEGEFERLGSTSTRKVSVRVIAATNKDLMKEVEDGNFRADLYYRLNVFPVSSIPLRERKEDIPLLVKHFLKKYASLAGKHISNVPKRTMNSLLAYHWPGNIRELENVIERAVILTQSNKLELGDWLPKTSMKMSEEGFEPLEVFEKKYILQVLNASKWRVSGEKGAAKILKMKPTTLESRMKKLNIKRS